jgi:TorA maturation chaperone TorD
MNTQDILDHEHLRFKTYRLLANAYYLPDQNLQDSLTKLGKCLEQICGEAGKYVKKIQADMGQKEGPEYLNVDYAKLFAGPFNLLAPPYGSVYLEDQRMVMGNSTVDVQKRYQEAGLDVDAKFKDAPDHIAAELEFMHFLVFKEMEASSEGGAGAFINCLLIQRSFLEDHLGAWISDFAGNIVNNAQTSFYQNLALATESFVKDDYHTISSMSRSWYSNIEKPVEFKGSLESNYAGL